MITDLPPILATQKAPIQNQSQVLHLYPCQQIHSLNDIVSEWKNSCIFSLVMSCVHISMVVIQLMVNSHSLELEFKLRSLALFNLNPELWISADNKGGLVSAHLNPWNPGRHTQKSFPKFD